MLDSALMDRMRVVVMSLQMAYRKAPHNGRGLKSAQPMALKGIAALARLLGVFEMTGHLPPPTHGILRLHHQLETLLAHNGAIASIRANPRRDERMFSQMVHGHAAQRAILRGFRKWTEKHAGEDLMDLMVDHPNETISELLVLASREHLVVFADWVFEIFRNSEDYLNETALKCCGASTRFRLYEDPEQAMVDETPGDPGSGQYLKTSRPSADTSVDEVRFAVGLQYKYETIQHAHHTLTNIKGYGTDNYMLVQNRNNSAKIHVDVVEQGLTLLDEHVICALRRMPLITGLPEELFHVLRASPVPLRGAVLHSHAILELAIDSLERLMQKTRPVRIKDEHYELLMMMQASLIVDIDIYSLFELFREGRPLLTTATSLLQKLPVEIAGVDGLALDSKRMHFTFPWKHWQRVHAWFLTRTHGENGEVYKRIIKCLKAYPVQLSTRELNADQKKQWHEMMRESPPRILRDDPCMLYAGPRALVATAVDIQSWPLDTQKRIEKMEPYITLQSIRNALRAYPTLNKSHLPNSLRLLERFNRVPIKLRRSYFTPAFGADPSPGGVILKGTRALDALRDAEEGPVGRAVRSMQGMTETEGEIVTGKLLPNGQYLSIYYRPDDPRAEETPSYWEQGPDGPITYLYNAREEREEHEKLLRNLSA